MQPKLAVIMVTGCHLIPVICVRRELMHRELYQLYVSGNIVVVQLALQGTHLGPLHLPAGTLPPTGKRMDAPCCDVFELVDGKIKRFDCYPEGSVILTQLGVIGNLSAALEH